MQCFICVTYMIILCSGNPTKTRDIDKYDKFSFVNNFIASLFHTQSPEELNDNEENKLSHNYKYGYDNYQQLLNEADFLPRRNDRIAMPPLQYRFPKTMRNTAGQDRVLDKPKEEVIIYINTNKSHKTESLKKERPRPTNKNKIDNENDDENQDTPSMTPFTNTMAGQSQIGDRESQTVVKPTVIVNIRGSVTNRDSDIRLDKKVDKDNETDITRNLFNINQEINLNTEPELKKKANEVKKEVKSVKDKTDEDMMMCESGTWKEEKNQERKLDNVVQILLTV